MGKTAVSRLPLVIDPIDAVAFVCVPCKCGDDVTRSFYFPQKASMQVMRKKTDHKGKFSFLLL